jgi:hypothetical protein
MIWPISRLAKATANMNSQSEPKESVQRNFPQFSLRTLFKLTLVVAFVMTIGVVSRDSRYFGELYSVWTLVSLLVIVAIWALDQLQLVRPRTVALWSLAIFLVSMCVPSYVRNPPTVGFGWHLAEILLARRDAFGWLFNESSALRWAGITISLKVLASILFIVGYVTLLISLKWKRALIATKCLATIGLISGIATLVTIEFAPVGDPFVPTDIMAPDPGYGLWIASLFALAAGSRSSK